MKFPTIFVEHIEYGLFWQVVPVFILLVCLSEKWTDKDGKKNGT